MSKRKPLPYKRGDEVLYIEADSNGIRLSQGVVTLVKQDELVYVSFDNGNWTWKRKFGRTPGNFQENPYPLWKLRRLNGDNLKKLKKRAKGATDNYRKYQDARRDIEFEVDTEARSWKYAEIERRVALLPHGWPYLRRVTARMGFKIPKK